jgi:uncharacterized protein (DUF2141 family)
MRAFVRVALGVGLVTSAASAATVRVDVTGFKSTTGEVRCAMFRDPGGFPRDLTRAERRVPAAIKADAATCLFENVAAGPAAVSVIHDANDNKKLDFKFGFIPREGLGWSNNPKVGMRPPSFEAARFDIVRTRLL